MGTAVFQNSFIYTDGGGVLALFYCSNRAWPKRYTRAQGTGGSGRASYTLGTGAGAGQQKRQALWAP